MKKYELASIGPIGSGGWVCFDWDNDVQAVRPSYGNTLVTLKSGISYLLRGRLYGV